MRNLAKCEKREQGRADQGKKSCSYCLLFLTHTQCRTFVFIAESGKYNNARISQNLFPSFLAFCSLAPVPWSAEVKQKGAQVGKRAALAAILALAALSGGAYLLRKRAANGGGEGSRSGGEGEAGAGTGNCTSVLRQANQGPVVVLVVFTPGPFFFLSLAGEWTPTVLRADEETTSTTLSQSVL